MISSLLCGGNFFKTDSRPFLYVGLLICLFIVISFSNYFCMLLPTKTIHLSKMFSSLRTLCCVFFFSLSFILFKINGTLPQTHFNLKLYSFNQEFLCNCLHKRALSGCHFMWHRDTHKRTSPCTDKHTHKLPYVIRKKGDSAGFVSHCHSKVS